MEMTYVDGFLVAVPTANKEAYREQAESAAGMFRKHGVTRLVECWGDDVPRGEVNDMYGAVQAKDDETVLFSWVEYPDRATRDAAHSKMHEEMGGDMPDMPFDGKRMVWSGFDIIHDDGAVTKAGYVDGVVLPVPVAEKDAYRDFAVRTAAAFREQGATRVVDAWGDDLMEGKLTDFHRASHRKDDETVVFSWVEWPDKAVRDAAWEKLMSDERLSSHDRPFDGKRMIFGGFHPIVDA
jgi:uncharacterized protein YbaA (DUF1428 family)